MGRCVYAAGIPSGIWKAVGHVSYYTFQTTRELFHQERNPFLPTSPSKEPRLQFEGHPRPTPIPPRPPSGRALLRPFPGLLLSLSLSLCFSSGP